MFQVVKTAVCIPMAPSYGQTSVRGGSGLQGTTGDPTTQAAGKDSAWRLLVGAVAGDAAMASLWREFEQTAQSRKPIIWSHGLTTTLDGLASPAEPISISAAPPPISRLSGKHTASTASDTASAPEDEVILPGTVWDHQVRTAPELIEPMLAAAATGPSELRAFLSEHGIHHRQPPPTMPDEADHGDSSGLTALTDRCSPSPSSGSSRTRR